MRDILWTTVLLLAGTGPVFSQVTVGKTGLLQTVGDSVDRYYRKHPLRLMTKNQKRFSLVPLFGVNYSQEARFSAMGGFSGTYRTSADPAVPLSQADLAVSVSTNLTVSGSFSGISYACGGRFVSRYHLKYHYAPRYFWGIGSDQCSEDGNRGLFQEQRVRVRADFLYRHGTLLAAGAFLGYDFTFADRFRKPELVTGLVRRTQYLYSGLRFELDTRDHPVQPQKGIQLKLEQTFAFPLQSSLSVFYRTGLVADFYFRGWKGAVFAIDLFGEFNTSAAPWTLWPVFGGNERMRGTYAGRYRDRNMLSAQLELRQTVYGAHGIALWGGAGLVFPSFRKFDIKNTLPTYGAGYRLSLLGFVLRLDVGFGRSGDYAVIAGINHSF